MKFRPCIDIHNGEVKQIVGSSLRDAGDYASENFIAGYDAAHYAALYRDKKLSGGHIILLNSADSLFFEASKQQAIAALKAYPGGMQIGGGITLENAEEYLACGASHVIVTSYVFHDGIIEYDRLEQLKRAIGKKQLVLDLSCRRKDHDYYIVTNRWQTYTSVKLTEAIMTELSGFCDEFLIHAVDVEGKNSGIEEEVVKILARSAERPVTYAGGVHSFADLDRLKELGNHKVDVTIGSALKLFGGTMELDEVIRYMTNKKEPTS